MLELIPKIKLSDKATWVDNDIIAISVIDLKNYKKLSLLNNRKIIILSIIPDQSSYNYIDLLDKYLPRIKKKKNNIQLLLTSCDCACYNDKPKWCDEELLYLIEENKILFSKYNIDIGILKGYNSLSYERMNRELYNHVSNYLLYITGEARSNPKFFSLTKFINDNFPNGINKPVYLHGCPIRQIESVIKSNINIKGIITAGYITDAIYRGHRHYSRKLRIKKAWDFWNDKVNSLNLR